jgi:hypothetical protein
MNPQAAELVQKILAMASRMDIQKLSSVLSAMEQADSGGGGGGAAAGGGGHPGVGPPGQPSGMSQRSPVSAPLIKKRQSLAARKSMMMAQ